MLIGIDRDEEALTVAKAKLATYQNIKCIYGNHDNIDKLLQDMDIEGVDGILLDLGISSYQIDNKERGFSYMSKDAKLDMRMDKKQTLTAKDIVNEYKEEKLLKIISEYGEERFAKNIVKNICITRKNKTIETAGELVEIIRRSIPAKFQNAGHPAKKTFQAIRIEVNNEIEPLYNTVMNSINALNKKGRLCIITFHSLEDRAVKMAYTKASRNLHLSKRITILCLWFNIFRKSSNKKTNSTKQRRNRRKFKSKFSKT